MIESWIMSTQQLKRKRFTIHFGKWTTKKGRNKMRIYGVKVEKVGDQEVTLDGNLVEWDYDGAPDGLGLTCRTI